MFLQSLGADASAYTAFQPYSSQGLVLARVAASHRKRYTLFTEEGSLLAEARGALLYRESDQAGLPVTGDWVAARIEGSHAIIEAVLPRKSVFSRKGAGRREDEQPLAANIDLIFLICGLDADFNLRRLERFLTLSAESRIEAVVVLNKTDVCPDLEARVAETASITSGTAMVATTTKVPGGVDGLHRFLAYGRTVALLGSSGVGKSAIINCLIGESRLRTMAVRESDSRGRHTTTRRELIPLPYGGAVIDTPGMREIGLWAGEDSLSRTFSDIAQIALGCRFRDCSHSQDSGCAVAAAVADGMISVDRWKSYLKLTAEAQRHEQRSHHLAAAARRKRDKATQRAMGVFYREESHDEP